MSQKLTKEGDLYIDWGEGISQIVICVQLLSKIFIDSVFCHNYLHTLNLFACLL